LHNVAKPGVTQGRRAFAIALASRPAMRWGWAVALAAGVLIAVLALSRVQPKAQPTGGDDAPLLAGETALGDAMRGGDKAAARRLLALQFSFVDADGKIYARKDFLADLKDRATAAVSSVKVRNYGLLAVVTGHRQSAHDADVFYLDIWVKQKGAWRILVMQEVAIAARDTPAVVPAAPAAEAPPHDCKNPCQNLPYRVRSVPEQDIITAFQAIEQAIVAHDAPEWDKHVADEFVLYRTGRPPVGKSERMAAIERQKESNATVTAGEVQTMRLAAYGDGAAMVADQTAPDQSRPPYRAARVWVRRNGQWLLAISVQTDMK
jgi:hypothetical protein